MFAQLPTRPCGGRLPWSERFLMITPSVTATDDGVSDPILGVTQTDWAKTREIHVEVGNGATW